MQIQKNKKGTYDLTGVSLGKLIALHAAIDLLESQGNATAVSKDVRDLIKNNPDYAKDTKG